MIAVMTGTFASSTVPFLDLAANQMEMGNRIMEQMKPAFADLGLDESLIRTFARLSLPFSALPAAEAPG